MKFAAAALLALAALAPAALAESPKCGAASTPSLETRIRVVGATAEEPVEIQIPMSRRLSRRDIQLEPEAQPLLRLETVLDDQALADASRPVALMLMAADPAAPGTLQCAVDKALAAASPPAWMLPIARAKPLETHGASVRYVFDVEFPAADALQLADPRQWQRAIWEFQRDPAAWRHEAWSAKYTAANAEPSNTQVEPVLFHANAETLGANLTGVVVFYTVDPIQGRDSLRWAGPLGDGATNAPIVFQVTPDQSGCFSCRTANLWDAQQLA